MGDSENIPRVLVVENSSTLNSMLIEKIENELGFYATGTASLEDTRRLIEDRDEKFFIALLGLYLEDAPNGEIVDYIKSKGIPCIILTGEFNEEIRENILSKEVVDYILKYSIADVDYTVKLIRRIYLNQTIKVLIIDDSMSFRERLKHILKNQLFEVIEARDGVAGMDQLRTNPDTKLILLDYDMPRMNGFDFIINIRKKFTRDRLAILVVSNFESNKVSSRLLKMGANDFINKSFSIEEFLSRVNHSLETLELIDTIREKANEDYLTGLYNRRYFYNEAKQILLEHRQNPENRFCIAMVDVDFFKLINDTHGHDTGDLVLKELAKMLKENTKGKDLISRFGGEEFCLLLQDTDRTGAITFIEKLRVKVENLRIYVGNTELSFTISLGICSEIKDSVEMMVSEADNQLYRAKKGGRNMVCAD